MNRWLVAVGTSSLFLFACAPEPPDDVDISLPGNVGVVQLAIQEGGTPTGVPPITVTNNGTSAMSVTITNFEANGGDWLGTSPTTLAVAAKVGTTPGSAAFDLTFATSTLKAGAYTATVHLDAVNSPAGTRAVGSPKSFPVNLTVTRNVAVLGTDTTSVAIDVPLLNTWTSATTVGAPSPRTGHTVTWTGEEFLVLGGEFSTDTGFYEPMGGSWRTTNIPRARYDHATVWDPQTNTVVVTGGRDASGLVLTAERYDVATDTWENSPALWDAQAGRRGHSMVAAGAYWITFGGIGADGDAMSSVLVCWFDGTECVSGGTPAAARFDHASAWTGDEMIIFGGVGPNELGGQLDDGWAYQPSSGNWRQLPQSGAPFSNPGKHGGAWTGKEFVVWSGLTPGGGPRFNAGFAYNPKTDQWRLLSIVNSPGVRNNHSVVWTGTRILVWGGTVNGPVNTGATYDPDHDALGWTPTPVSAETPTGRIGFVGAWNGERYFVFGGTGPNTLALDTGILSYAP